MVAVVGAYQPGCRRVCVELLACWGVLGMSLPLAKTGVSGSEQEVCIPEPVETLVMIPPPVPLLQPPLLVSCPATIPLLLPLPLPLPPPPPDGPGSIDGECLFVNGRRREGPGRSVGRVRRSTGICCKRQTGINNSSRLFQVKLTPLLFLRVYVRAISATKPNR